MRLRWPSLYAIAFIIYLLYRLAVALTFEPPAYHQNPVRGDMNGYAAALVQHENPADYKADILYGDGARQTLFWSASRIYMHTLSALHDLTDGDIGLALRLFSVLLAGIYLPGMFLLLYRLCRDHLMAAGIAFVSLIPAGFAGTGTQWGIGADSVFPLTLSTVIAPWLLWVLMGALPASLWMIFGVGVTGGLSLLLIHSVNGLAFLQLITGWLIVQALRRQVPVKAVIAFMAGWLPSIGLYLLGTDSVQSGFGFADSQAVIAFGQINMVFPWGGGGLIGLDLRDYEMAYVIFFAVHLSLTVFLLIGWAQKGGRFWPLMLIPLQVISMIVLTRTGWLPWVILAYGWSRAWRRQWDDLDIALILMLILSLLIGPLQQTLLYYVWSATEKVSLTSFLFEMARFQHFFYLPFFALLGRAAVWFLAVYKDQTLRGMLAIGFAGAVALNLNDAAYQLTPTITDGALVLVLVASVILIGHRTPRIWSVGLSVILGLMAGVAAIVALVWLELYGPNLVYVAGLVGAILGLTLGQWRVHPRQAAALTCIMVAFVILVFPVLTVETVGGVPLDLDDALEMSEQARENFTPPLGSRDISPETALMTAWVRQNTPHGAYFHTMNLDRSFFYAARRPITIGFEEWPYGMYSADQPPLTLQKLETRLILGQRDAQILVDALNELGVDYVLGQQSDTPPLITGDSIVYQDARYTIYEVAKLPPDQHPLRAMPELYALYQAHDLTLPLPDDAVIFNPTTGTLSDRADLMRAVGALVTGEDALLDLLVVLDRMRYESQLSLEPDALARWRDDKAAKNLRNAGADYLLVQSDWAGFLTESEQAALNDSANYELLREWDLPTGWVQLYRVKG